MTKLETSILAIAQFVNENESEISEALTKANEQLLKQELRELVRAWKAESHNALAESLRN